MPWTVVVDPDAALELGAVGSRAERRAIGNALAKLRDLGPDLQPPHLKTLRGNAAGGLLELRPRRGDSDWRLLGRRSGTTIVILAVCRHRELRAAIDEANRRWRRYAHLR